MKLFVIFYQSMSYGRQGILLCKISLALLALNGCKQAATDIEYTKRMYQLHYVKKGETLDTLAKRYDMTRDELIFINQLSAPYTLVPRHRLHVHKRRFVEWRDELPPEEVLVSETSYRSSKKSSASIELEDFDDDPPVGRPRIKAAKLTPIVVKRKGLGRLFVPIFAVGATLAALRPRMAFAAPSPSTGTGGGGSPVVITPPPPRPTTNTQGTGTNPQGFDQITSLIDGGMGGGGAPIETRNQFLKKSAFPAFAALAGGGLLGGGAALLMNAVSHNKKGVGGSVMAAGSPGLKSLGCDVRPCFVWPINNKKRQYQKNPRAQGIFIINTMGERYVRPANHGVIEKIIVPQNTGNKGLYTVVINHAYGTCRSSFKSVYSGLVKVSEGLKPGMFIGRDIILGEAKPCCNSTVSFSILDKDRPVADTRRYLPGV